MRRRSPPPRPSASRRSAAGVRRALKLADAPLYHALVGGQLVVSSSPRGPAALRAGGAKLSADPDFQAAKKLVRMPDATTGFVYAKGLGGFRTFVGFTERNLHELTFSGYLIPASS